MLSGHQKASYTTLRLFLGPIAVSVVALLKPILWTACAYPRGIASNGSRKLDRQQGMYSRAGHEHRSTDELPPSKVSRPESNCSSGSVHSTVRTLFVPEHLC